MYEVNKIYDTPKGKIKVLARIKKETRGGKVLRHPRVIIQMLDTGTVLNVQTCNIGTGHFFDYMKPSVYGVGFIGSTIKIPSRSSGSIIRRIYDLWANMLKRCYGGWDRTYSDAKVDHRWHNFTNFLNSIQDVEGYELWEKNPKMHLDKDIIDYSKRLYSRDTCKFVTPAENVKEMLDRRWHRK